VIGRTFVRSFSLQSVFIVTRDILDEVQDRRRTTLKDPEYRRSAIKADRRTVKPGGGGQVAQLVHLPPPSNFSRRA